MASIIHVEEYPRAFSNNNDVITNDVHVQYKSSELCLSLLNLIILLQLIIGRIGFLWGFATVGVAGRMSKDDAYGYSIDTGNHSKF